MAGAPKPDERADSAEDTVSSVGMPKRRGPARPVPWAVRRASSDGPMQRWFPLGTVDSGTIARADPAGLVQLDGAVWSLDWWIGAEDRWHHPSMDTGIAQSPLEGSAVIETRLRVPGGVVLHRCGGARYSTDGTSGDAVVVEVHNDSAVPVALALVVRPYTLEGEGRVSTVDLEPAGASAVEGPAVMTVDGRSRLVLDRMPRRTASGASTDLADLLARGQDEDLPAEGIRKWTPTGGPDLEVAVVVPLAHGATVSAILPTGAATAGRSRRRSQRNALPEPAAFASMRVPEVGAVVSGWGTHGAEDPTLEWTVESASEFLAWSGSMLRVAGPDAVTATLGADGTGAPAATSLDSLCAGLSSLPAAELHDAVASAIIGFQRFSGKVELADRSDATDSLLRMAATILVGAHGPERCMELVGPVAKALRWRERHPAEASLLGASVLGRLAAGLTATGQPEVARQALAQLELGSPARSSAGGGSAPDPAELGPALDSVMPGAGTARLVGQPVVQGFDVVRVAELRRRLLDSVVEDLEDGPSVAAVWRPEWNGRTFDVRRMPTAWGPVSASLRWHGERAALLWEVEPWFGSTGEGAPLIRAGELAPGWSASGWSGEALVTPSTGVDGHPGA